MHEGRSHQPFGFSKYHTPTMFLPSNRIRVYNVYRTCHVHTVLSRPRRHGRRAHPAAAGKVTERVFVLTAPGRGLVDPKCTSMHKWFIALTPFGAHLAAHSGSAAEMMQYYRILRRRRFFKTSSFIAMNWHIFQSLLQFLKYAEFI